MLRDAFLLFVLITQLSGCSKRVTVPTSGAHSGPSIETADETATKSNDDAGRKPSNDLSTVWVNTISSDNSDARGPGWPFWRNHIGAIVEIQSGTSMTETEDGAVFLVGDYDGRMNTADAGTAASTAGQSKAAEERDIFWSKTDSSGKMSRMAFISSRGRDLGHSITTATDGSLFIGGRAGGPFRIGDDLVTREAVGEEVDGLKWEEDRDWHPYKAKHYETEGLMTPVLIKYAADGKLAWVRAAGRSSDGIAQVTGTALLSDGSVVAAGTFTGTLTYDKGLGRAPATLTCKAIVERPCVFMVKYDWNGYFQWAKKPLCEPGDAAGAEGKADTVDPRNKAPHPKNKVRGNMTPEVYALGDDTFWLTGQVRDPVRLNGGDKPRTMSPLGESDVFLARFDTDGGMLNLTRWRSTGAARIEGAAVTSDGALVAVGAFSGELRFDDSAAGGRLNAAAKDDGFVVRLDKSGVVAWARRWGDEHKDAFLDVTSLSDNSLLVVGARNVRMENTAKSDSPTAGVLRKYSDDGVLLYEKQLKGAGKSILAAAAAFPDGSAVVAGMFAGEIEIDDRTLIAQGAQDVFLWKVSGISPSAATAPKATNPPAIPRCRQPLDNDATLKIRGATVSEAAHFLARYWGVNVLMVGESDDRIYFDMTPSDVAAAFKRLAALSGLDWVQEERLFIIGPRENLARLRAAEKLTKQKSKSVDLVFIQVKWQELARLLRNVAYSQIGEVTGNVTMYWRDVDAAQVQGTLLALAGASYEIRGGKLVLNEPASLPVSHNPIQRTHCPKSSLFANELTCVPLTDLELIGVSTAKTIPAALLRRRTPGLGYGSAKYARRGDFVGQIPEDTYTALDGRIHPLGIVSSVDKNGVDVSFGWIDEEIKRRERIELNRCRP